MLYVQYSIGFRSNLTFATFLLFCFFKNFSIRCYLQGSVRGQGVRVLSITVRGQCQGLALGLALGLGVSIGVRDLRQGQGLALGLGVSVGAIIRVRDFRQGQGLALGLALGLGVCIRVRFQHQGQGLAFGLGVSIRVRGQRQGQHQWLCQCWGQHKRLALGLRVSIRGYHYRLGLWVSVRVTVRDQCLGYILWLGFGIRVKAQFQGLSFVFTSFLPSSDWRHNSSSQAVALCILTAKQTLK